MTNEFTRYAADLARAATGIDKAGDAAEERAAKGALGTARSVAPEDEGDMIREMRVVKRGDGWALESPNVASVFQEYGTSEMAPNPSIGPAVDVWGPRLIADVEGIRDDVVRKL